MDLQAAEARSKDALVAQGAAQQALVTTQQVSIANAVLVRYRDLY